MIVLKDPSQIQSIEDPLVRQWLELRFRQLGTVDGFIVVEPDDRVADLETISGCPIVHDLFDEYRFGDEDFAPCFEVLEDHGQCFEMVFILNDDGAATMLFIPKSEGVDTELLTLCSHFAI